MAWNEPGNNNGNNGRDNDPWGNNNRGGSVLVVEIKVRQI